MTLHTSLKISTLSNRLSTLWLYSWFITVDSYSLVLLHLFLSCCHFRRCGSYWNTWHYLQLSIFNRIFLSISFYSQLHVKCWSLEGTLPAVGHIILLAWLCTNNWHCYYLSTREDEWVGQKKWRTVDNSVELKIFL